MQGNAQAQLRLGNHYSSGKGVLQDNKEAVKWYRRAAMQGNAQAQSNLGVMYMNGHGVLQNYVQAHMWFNIAAANGYKAAIKKRDLTAKTMTPADISKAQAMAKEWMKKFEARKK